MVSETVRQQVIERARGRCEYCQTPITVVIEMEIDHIVPRAVGGSDTLDNLCVACISCNGYKLAFQEGIDPTTGEPAALFNPRRQTWADHFTWDDEEIRVVGLTPTGRATVERLRMNRQRVIDARRLWVQAGWHPPKD